MYIIEVFVRWLNKNKRGTGANPTKGYKEGVILDNDGEPIKEEIDEALTCKHNFMPVDSTGQVLACTKCGFVVKRRDNKKLD